MQQDVRATANAIQRGVRDPTGLQLGYAFFYIVFAAVLWRVFQRAMLDVPEGMFTGVVNNFGDLPFHISVISGFRFRE